ncbi:MAG TPA: hypothetical protein VGO11_13900 [Chthoniobacteraceae bacterium]|jgi:hypothetical protein|nr:hypothetical protein [Chthoniobacteraceae bacterium]
MKTNIAPFSAVGAGHAALRMPPWPAGLTDARIEALIARRLPEEEAEETEELLSADPVLHARVLAARRTLDRMTSHENVVVAPDKFPNEEDRVKEEEIACSYRAAAGLAAETNVITVCFREPAAAAAKAKLSREEDLAGPPGVRDEQGRPYPVRLTVRETTQGDILLAVETDPALADRTLRVGDAATVVFRLAHERGKGFAMLTLSPEEFLAVCRQSAGAPSYEWA